MRWIPSCATRVGRDSGTKPRGLGQGSSCCAIFDPAGYLGDCRRRDRRDTDAGCDGAKGERRHGSGFRDWNHPGASGDDGHRPSRERVPAGWLAHQDSAHRRARRRAGSAPVGGFDDARERDPRMRGHSAPRPRATASERLTRHTGRGAGAAPRRVSRRDAPDRARWGEHQRRLSRRPDRKP